MIEPTRIIPAREAAGGPDEPWEESLGLFRPAAGATPPREDGPDTQPLPRTEPPPGRASPQGSGPQGSAPRTEARPRRPRHSPRARRALRIAALTGTGGAAGFALAFALLSPGIGLGAGPGAPQGAAPAGPGTPSAAAPDAPGASAAGGVLREGDSGPAVSELQSRLLRIPNVYAGGAVDGRFDGRLAAAVARFQVWYGVRGDESGEYGDATRRDLQSRTALASG
ncbi:peptidoglycan-binding protein [Streptomyces sp. NPDC026673]|uniref:peptidoglycan-binding domain-containing protein n=1 Tax=Streptomyces sp. NPDC026673 TaxID=3155724 RepID=UPI0033C7C567